MISLDGPITQLLRDCKNDNPTVASPAVDELSRLIYGELKRMAKRRMKAEVVGHTLQATILANDVFFALVKESKIDINDRAHFFALSSRLMRQRLIDYARNKKAKKRGGEGMDVSLDDAIYISIDPRIELIALDEALTKLEELDSAQSELVEMLYFTGLTQEETAELLGCSVSTVQQRWYKAKAWLFNELTRQ